MANLAVLADTFEEALLEAEACKRMDALDDIVLANIAADYHVDVTKLREALDDDYVT